MTQGTKQETRKAYRQETQTESMTPRERTKANDRNKEGSQAGELSSGESVEALMSVTMMTGVRKNVQPDNLECRRGSISDRCTVFLCVNV